jgi:type II secretion system protein F
MPEYFYEAIDSTGNKITGTEEAPDTSTLVASLVSRGFQPVNVKPARKIGLLFLSGKRKFTFDNLLYFTRELGDLMEAGVTLERALAIISDSAEQEDVKEILERIREDIKGGKKLSDALASYPEIFDSMYVNMVRVGELGGVLPAVFKRLDDFLERSRQIKKFIISSSIYPGILLTVGILSVLILITFVVPKFGEIFNDLNQPMPLMTRIIVDASSFIRSWWWLIIIVITMLCGGFYAYIQSPQGRTWWHHILLRMPLAGNMVTNIQISRFARTLGTLIESGVPILKGIALSGDVVTNTVIKNAVKELYRGVRQGKNLSRLMKHTGVFPSIMVHLVAVGEETGAMGEMLIKIADDLDDKIQSDTKVYLSLVEPVTIVLMGVLIGGIILSMLMAIFGINDVAM